MKNGIPLMEGVKEEDFDNPFNIENLEWSFNMQDFKEIYNSAEYLELTKRKDSPLAKFVLNKDEDMRKPI